MVRNNNFYRQLYIRDLVKILTASKNKEKIGFNRFKIKLF